MPTSIGLEASYGFAITGTKVTLSGTEVSIMESKGNNNETIASLARGIRAMECFSPSKAWLSLTDIAEELAIPKASAYRIVSTLVSVGCLQYDPDSKRYRLGLKTLEFGYACLAGLQFPEAAQPILEELANRTRESASMAILDGDEIVYVARVASRRVMSVNLSIGARLPVHCTSMGRILLAGLDEVALQKWLEGVDLVAYTPFTLLDKDQLAERVRLAREQGFTVTSQELEVGLTSAAAPVRNAQGRVVAAINVSTFTSRYTDVELNEKVVPTLVEAAQTISNALGFRPGVRRDRR